MERQAVYVESVGNLDQHEADTQRALHELGDHHGSDVVVESVSLSTTAFGNVIRYSSVLLVQLHSK